MGDNFLEEQAKNSKRRRAKAKTEMGVPKLLTRPDEVADEFTIDCHSGQELKLGEELRCFPSVIDDTVDVARAHRQVGSVGEGGGSVLRQFIDQSGVGRLRIRSVNPLTGTAQAEIIKE